MALTASHRKGPSPTPARPSRRAWARRAIGEEVYQKSVKLGTRRGLLAMAEQCRVGRRLRSYVEALIA